MKQTILVTGATGHTGGHVVRQLLEHGGVTIKALTRTPEKATFPAGVQVVKGDLGDPASLDEALRDVDQIFLVWPTMFTEESGNEVIPKLAAQASRIVYLSAAGAETNDDPDNASHGRIEALLRQHAKEWTFLRSGGHMSNDLGTPVPADGVVSGPFLSWARSQIHPGDLAAVGVHALLTDDLVNKATPMLTGEELMTGAERITVVADLVGRPVTKVVEIPAAEARDWFLAWVPPEDVDAIVSTMTKIASQPEPMFHAIRQILGRPATPYRQWVLEHLPAFVEPTAEGVGRAFVSLVNQGESATAERHLLASGTGPAVGPYVRDDRFAVVFPEESAVGVYTVREGKIVSEERFS
ncbi:NAD(P)H-binding protein [Nonomuraea sp. NBC_01738]|uniref:SDR family oxidoreductase n=1 Tax=Nonomuraea sp. NBC_01738 TaxID=2976003 RepID=UPI002E15501E|nr:NAD(P)H-binding protein [Nonomuraea sp. NBC_01738]